jgi:hypothetical protein
MSNGFKQKKKKHNYPFVLWITRQKDLSIVFNSNLEIDF